MSSTLREDEASHAGMEKIKAGTSVAPCRSMVRVAPRAERDVRRARHKKPPRQEATTPMLMSDGFSVCEYMLKRQHATQARSRSIERRPRLSACGPFGASLLRASPARRGKRKTRQRQPTIMASRKNMNAMPA